MIQPIQVVEASFGQGLGGNVGILKTVNKDNPLKYSKRKDLENVITHWPVLEGLQAVCLQQQVRAGILWTVNHIVSLLVALLTPRHISAVIGGQYH